MNGIGFSRSPRIPLVVALLGTLIYLMGVTISWAQESEADVVTAQAILAYDDKKYEEALSFLEHALKISPNHTEALYYAGLVLMAQGRYEESLPYLTRAYAVAPDSISIMFQLGVAYFSLEQYDKADPLLTRVFEERPATNNVGYYVGFMRYQDQQYQEALRAFRAGASDDERILQLTNFYSGLALTSLGLPNQADEEFRESMRRRTVSPLTGPADRLRDTLAASENDADRLHGQVQIGGFYDTNVAAVPLSTGSVDVETARSVDTQAPGVLASLYLDYAWFREGALESTLSYSFYQTLIDQISDLNVQNHWGNLGWFYRDLIGTMPFQTGLQLNLDNTTLGGDQFLTRYSLSIFGTLVESQRHLTTVQTSAQSKDFEDDEERGDDALSGTNWMVGMTHMVRFSGDKHLIRGGFQFDTDAALGQNFDYTGFLIQAGAAYTLPWEDVRLRYDFDVHFRNYDNPNTTFRADGSTLDGAPPEVKQKVIEQNHVIRVEKLLPKNITVALDWQLTFSRSNIDILFNFDRQVLTGSVAWAF